VPLGFLIFYILLMTTTIPEIQFNENLHKHFPHGEYREYQKDSITYIDYYFKMGVKTIILESPTGSGKSAVAMTLALNSDNAFVLTSQKILQDQYTKDFCDNPKVKVLKGKTNYVCTKRLNTNCAEGQVLVNKCSDPKTNEHCTYVRARNEALRAKAMLLNYNYYFSAIELMGKRELLICDEAHKFESILMQHTEFTLSTNKLKKYNSDFNIPDYKTIEEYLEWLDDLRQDLLHGIDTLMDMISAFGKSPQAKPKLKEVDFLQRLCDKINGFLHSNKETEWVYYYKPALKNDDFTEIVFKPLKIDYFIGKYLDKVDKKLFMSATILDYKSFCRTLGIDPSEVYYLTIPSTFPPKNNPIKFMSVGNMGYKYISETLPNMMGAIEHILNEHKDDKGIIHTHSFRISKYIEDNISDKNGKRAIFTESDKRDINLEEHKHAKQPTFLVSPSMTEGIDLPDDLARFCILTKIPYPSLADKQIKRRMEMDADWYAWQTCYAIVQSVGRGSRHKDDWCKIYLLDSAFRYFIEKNRRFFPKHFLDAMIFV